MNDNNEYDLKIKRSPVPFVGVGIFWLIWAIVFPLYAWYHFAMVSVFSLGIYFLGNRIFPPKQIKVPRPAKLELSGDVDVDKLVKGSWRKLENIENLAKIIQPINAPLAEDTSELVSSGYKILNYVTKFPDRMPLIRRFLTYYVPTLDKLLESYIDFKRHGTARETVAEIEDTVPSMKSVFRKQLDKLMEDRELDISTDIDVLESKLSSDGLKMGVDGE